VAAEEEEDAVVGSDTPAAGAADFRAEVEADTRAGAVAVDIQGDRMADRTAATARRPAP